MSRVIKLTWPAVLAIVASSFDVVHAQPVNLDPRLVLSVRPEFGVSRGHAPVAITTSLRWNAPELIEGRLHLDWFVEQHRLGHYFSPELALSDSSVILNIQLPPIVLSHDDATVSVRGRFVTEDVIYDLDVHDLALQPDWRRILVVGLCTTPQRPDSSIISLEISRRQQELAGHFELEQFFSGRFQRRELLVDSAEVDPADVPVEALKFTAFDLFAVPADSLARLKIRQLDALGTWVRAGGSLCLFVDSGIPPGHLDWLNRFVGGGSSGAVYRESQHGQIERAGDPSAALHRHYVELGRLLVALEPPDPESEEWKQSLLFLWKARKDRQSAIARGQQWQVPRARFANTLQQFVSLAPSRIGTRSELTPVLLPTAVTGLPLTTVVILLALFLIVIAPGDYFLLGWLRRRRWTWILFPSASLLFTGYMMWIARQHLGESSYVHSITVVDLGSDDQPVRTSQFQLLFPALTQQVATSHEQELIVPLDPRIAQYGGQTIGATDIRDYEPPWTYLGRIPRKYVLHREVQQWAPRLARRTTFGSMAASGELLEEMAVDSASSGRTDAELETVVLELTGDQRDVLRVNPEIPEAIVDLAVNATARRSGSYFSVVSQISPNCAGNWEDLALLDPSDPSQSVRIEITSPATGRYVVTRRLQRESP